MAGKNPVRKVAEAHTNLTMFHAIIALAESGCFYGAHPELSKIIDLAKAGAQRQFRAYDRAMAEVQKQPSIPPKRDA